MQASGILDAGTAAPTYKRLESISIAQTKHLDWNRLLQQTPTTSVGSDRVLEHVSEPLGDFLPSKYAFA